LSLFLPFFLYFFLSVAPHPAACRGPRGRLNVIDSQGECVIKARPFVVPGSL
jgi:hypothetical protein